MRRGRYRLKTDIASFYPSVYTHAIEWALEGKQAAKNRVKAREKRSQVALGSELDALARAGQEGQTIGLPIGPDTSLILAELILCGLDVQLEEAHPGIAARGWRWFDDLEVFTESLGEAEDVLTTWQTLLDDFELTIAAEKTVIEPGPFSLEPRWRSRLAQAPLRLESDRTAENDLIALYSEAFEIKVGDPSSRALAYVAGRTSRQLYGVRLGQRTSRTLLNLMMIAAHLEPSTLPLVARNLNRVGPSIDVAGHEALADSMNELVRQHARKDHGSETTWALHICLQFALKIEDVTAREVAEARDPFTLVLLSACTRAGLLPDASALEPAIARAEADGAWDSSDWILALEMARMGLSNGDSLQGVPGWGDLLRHDVGFLTLDGPTEVDSEARSVSEPDGAVDEPDVDVEAEEGSAVESTVPGHGEDQEDEYL